VAGLLALAVGLAALGILVRLLVKLSTWMERVAISQHRLWSAIRRTRRATTTDDVARSS